MIRAIIIICVALVVLFLAALAIGLIAGAFRRDSRIGRWSGTVKSVHGKRFRAEIDDLTEVPGEPRVAILRFKDVVANERELIQPGTVIDWTVERREGLFGLRIQTTARVRKIAAPGRPSPSKAERAGVDATSSEDPEKSPAPNRQHWRMATPQEKWKRLQERSPSARRRLRDSPIHNELAD